MSPSRERETEADRLRARVAELEAQLAAKPPIDRFSLYRMVNNALWGVMAVNVERCVDYANPAMQPWLAVPALVRGLLEADALGPALREVLTGPLAEALGKMDPADTPGTRATVEAGEVVVDAHIAVAK